MIACLLDTQKRTVHLGKFDLLFETQLLTGLLFLAWADGRLPIIFIESRNDDVSKNCCCCNILNDPRRIGLIESRPSDWSTCTVLLFLKTLMVTLTKLTLAPQANFCISLWISNLLGCYGSLSSPVFYHVYDKTDDKESSCNHITAEQSGLKCIVFSVCQRCNAGI